MQDAFEVRVAHADLVHVLKRVADVVDARAANADALCDESRAAVQIELAHVGRMLRIGDECERAHGLVLELYRYQTRLVDPARHLAVPQASKRTAQTRRIDPIRHAPARPAAA